MAHRLHINAAALAALLGSGLTAATAQAQPGPPLAPAASAPGVAQAAPTATPPAVAASAPAAAASASAAAAPPASAASATTLAPVTITGKAPLDAGVAGWGDVPLSQAPVAATAIDAAQIRDAGARRLADLIKFDAAVADAYDTEGYYDAFTVRGFVIDNRFNFRRDGLPINGETAFPLENKARVDVLKGLSGLQAGTSAPGGLVDLAVKRPLDNATLRSAFLEWRERGSMLGAVDLSQRFGEGGAFGVRLNAAAERIDPQVEHARGQRHALALAGEARLGGTLLEAEIETSHKSQPSVPGFSLLGDRMPELPSPRLNLNNQPWSLPVVFDATTASLRATQRLGADWRLVGHAVVQRLRTDDRIAFPFGCFDPNPAPDGTYYADRYCPDGTFDLYDFRSENEQRLSRTLDVSLRGRARTGAIAHGLTLGVQRTLIKNRFQAQAFNFAGTGHVDGTLVTPPAPDPTTPGIDRDERSNELYLRDAVALNERTTLWLGARHSRLERAARATDDSFATRYEQSFTTPFAALSHAFRPGQIVYASWGRGVESDVAPALPRYANAGQALPAAQSRQLEAGAKGGSGGAEWSVAAFAIDRPLFGDLGACDVDGSCTRALAGRQRHRGVEGAVAWRRGAWDLRAGAQWLHARIEAPGDAARDGKRPTNVPATSLRAEVRHRLGALPGLELQVNGTVESEREVTPDNSASIPGYARFDLGARYERRVAGVAWTLRAGIDNVFDRRAWRESPYQFGHAYLFALAPRTFRLSLQADL